MRSCTRCALGKPAEARIAEQYIPALVKLVRELSSRFEGLTGTKPSSSDALAYMVTRHMAMRSHQQEDK
jgi:hypothetical protein